MSYMVMECHPGYVILLDENARFLKAANLRYEVGQTIYDPVLMREDTQKNLHKIRWITSSLAAVAACFLMVFGLRYYQNHMIPYSSIYLSINPQVQMDLNRQGTIIKLTAMNADGSVLLADYDGKGKDKVTVADELIDRAIQMGYLSEGGRVSFSIDAPDNALFTKYGEELNSGVKEHLDGRMTITMEILSHSMPQNQSDISDTEGSSKPKQPERPSNNETIVPPTPDIPADTDYVPGNDNSSDEDDDDDEDSGNDEADDNETDDPADSDSDDSETNDSADSDSDDNEADDSADNDSNDSEADDSADNDSDDNEADDPPDSND